MKNLILTFSILIFITACSQKNTSKNETSSSSETEESIAQVEAAAIPKKINKPLEDIAPKPTTYRVSASEGKTIVTEKGTTITIPENTFSDINGNPITGEIELSFQEFHTPTDVILSGIPMHIEDENGSLEPFETAGMFTINGKDDEGNEIRIAEGKEIQVELATLKEDENFNFYAYDKVQGLWKEEYKNTNVSENTAKASLSNKIGLLPPLEQPVAIQKAASSDFVFELGIDKAKNPEFDYFDDMLWKLAPGSEGDKELISKVIRNPKLTCVDQEKSIFTLSGVAGKQDVRTKVQPVLFGSNYKKAKAAFNKKVKLYKQGLEERKNLKTRMDMMADFQRDLSITGMGTYNCDRYSRMKFVKKINLKVALLAPALGKIFNQAVLIIKEKKGKITVPLYSGTGGYFIYAPSEDNTLITFDEDGNIYEFTNEDFKALTASKPRKDKTTDINLDMTTYKITSADELTSYLDQI